MMPTNHLSKCIPYIVCEVITLHYITLHYITGCAAGAQAPKQTVAHDMRCALMNLSLPMEPLAQQLLQ